MTRGYRNNNPLNIRKSIDSWLGEVIPSTDTAFKQFKTMAYGYRAAFKLLYNYQHRYGCYLLSDFINRWAPPKENNTIAYIKSVCEKCGLSDVSTVCTTDAGQMMRIVSAMAFVENGEPADMLQVRAGWELFANEIMV